MNLSVVDNLDLTATFTVTGSSGAGSVIATRFRGIEGPQTASSTVWSFTGDGASSPTTMIPGHYFFQAIQGGNTSPIVYQAIQDPTPAESVLCRNAVQDRIKLLALDGWQPQTTLIHKIVAKLLRTFALKPISNRPQYLMCLSIVLVS
jgi:hypothetical protein